MGISNNEILVNDSILEIQANSPGNIWNLKQENFPENVKFRLSGKFDLSRILPTNPLYKSFGSLTSYDLEISKSADQFTIFSRNLKMIHIRLLLFMQKKLEDSCQGF